MTASRLRAAAELLRTRAAAAICPCGGSACTIENWFRIGELEARFDGSEHAAPFVEMMSPLVALALADWLDKYADIQPQARHVSRPAYSDLAQALALADAILGTSTTDTMTNEGRDE